MKILFWQIDGFVLYYKRLECGTFAWSEFIDASTGAEILAEDFELLLTGINPSTGKQQKRFGTRQNLARYKPFRRSDLFNDGKIYSCRKTRNNAALQTYSIRIP